MEIDPARIERAIARAVEAAVVVERDGDSLVLSGLVSTEDERDEVIAVARELAPPDVDVVDNLEVEGVLPEEIEGMHLSEAGAEGIPGATPGTSDDEALEPGDFSDQEILEDPLTAAGPTGAAEDEDIAEGEEVYVPPTDPVRDREGEFLGGFQTTAMDDDEEEIDTGVLPGPADEALIEAVQHELREDAETTALEIRVSARAGIVTLRGRVQDELDVENALAVAARVPGVVEVRDHLQVAA